MEWDGKLNEYKRGATCYQIHKTFQVRNCFKNWTFFFSRHLSIFCFYIDTYRYLSTIFPSLKFIQTFYLLVLNSHEALKGALQEAKIGTWTKSDRMIIRVCTLEKVPSCRSWKARYSHFLKKGQISDFQIFIDSDRKKAEL